MNKKLLEAASRPVIQQVDWQGVTVMIVREDLNHPIVQGNKFRKLIPNLKAAKAQGAKVVVTFGGAHSNHLLATACAAEMFGFKSVGWVRGEELAQQRSQWSDTLIRCKEFGMQLAFMTRGEYREKHRSQAFLDQWGTYDQPHLIPEGGSNELATHGVATLIAALAREVKPPSHLICPVGTGGTVAGLIRGAAEHHWDCQVIGVCVLKGLQSVNHQINQWLSGLRQLPEWQIDHRFHGGGYAKIPSELIQFARAFTTRTKIPLDKVYNAKSFYACDQLIRSGVIKSEDQPMVIHTGGLQGGALGA